ncbi:MAG: nonribosomal peptide synthetase MxaA [Methylovirgula sp.]
MLKGAIAALILFGLAQTCAAQLRNVDVAKPRLFGYFVGDVLRDEVDVDVDEGTELVRASVPERGPLNAWLELSQSSFETTHHGNITRYRLHLSYQTFYPALDARQIDIPGFTLSFKTGDHIYPVSVPSWSFGISPLREVLPEAKASGADYMQPDVLPTNYDYRRTAIWAFGLLTATLIAAILLARHMALWPFGARPQRPFTVAARTVRKLSTQGETQLAYREALVAVHRAVDATASYTVFAEDVPAFLGQHPIFARLKDQFAAFFVSSQNAFFSDRPSNASGCLSLPELRQFSNQLAVAERSAT